MDLDGICTERVTSCGSQIQFLGSDGNRYLFLAKPKDDLRKDARMMEMMGVLNRLLAKHPASRRRNLFVRRCARKKCHPIWVRHMQCLLGGALGRHNVSSRLGHQDPPS